MSLVEQPKQQENKEDFDTWVESFYQETYSVELAGRKFTFRRYYPNTLEKEIRGMDQADAARFILAYTSVEPKLTAEQIGRLPEPLLGVLIAKYMEIQKENNQVVYDILPELTKGNAQKNA